MPCISKLLEIASSPICQSVSSSDIVDIGCEGERFEELHKLLERRNGFYVFESALHVFPLCKHQEHMTLQQWNANSMWKFAYEGAADRVWCFAEDIFGEQFGIIDETVVLFNSETGQIEEIAKTLEEWACRILTEFKFLTGHPLAHEWQMEHGLIVQGQRLAPKVPFILGGEYNLTNLYAGDATQLMRFRGDVYRQIRDLPDGAQVKLTVR